ncbi:lipopolysaccharide biosynthesis protein [Lacrimispora sp.]|uniref:lipopolysaccharide biosynthesis protein n=1 Tax=Lacrimispora sp. TaxID=2719234 RepID=UPI003460EAFF
MQRTKRSFFNVIVTLVTNVVILLTAFMVQRILISTMGSDYNGINGLFTSIISMMSLTDMGIGSAIIYHLYRPAATSDYNTIRSLLRFYRNSYMAISGVVLLIGIVLMFFIPALVGDVVIHESLYLIFGLFMTDCLVSYFLSYKKSLLYAYQMNYILDGVHFVFYLAQNIAQIVVLLYFKSFIVFLLLKTISKCIENIAITIYIRRRYPFASEKKILPLDSEIRSDIIMKVKALLFHRLGKLSVTGGDSLVITGVLGILQMSLYTNYHLILGGITALLNKVFETLTSSVGNFLLDSDKKQRYEVYRKIDFLNFWFFGCAAVVLYTTIQPIIILWVGDQYLFSKITLFFLIINFYQEGMRASVTTFKEAAGIYYTDRFMPLIEAAFNVMISIFFAQRMGIKGVFLGTIISSGIIFFYSYPKYVCIPLFHMSWIQYVKQTVQHFMFTIIAILGVGWFVVWLNIGDSWIAIVASGLVSMLAFHILLLCIYWRSDEMRYFVSVMLKLVIKRRSV